MRHDRRPVVDRIVSDVLIADDDVKNVFLDFCESLTSVNICRKYFKTLIKGHVSK